MGTLSLQVRKEQEALEALATSRALPLQSSAAQALATSLQLRLQLSAYPQGLAMAVARALDDEARAARRSSRRRRRRRPGSLPPAAERALQDSLGQLNLGYQGRVVPLGPHGVLRLPTAAVEPVLDGPPGSPKPWHFMPVGAAGLPLHLLRPVAPPRPAARRFASPDAMRRGLGGGVQGGRVEKRSASARPPSPPARRAQGLGFAWFPPGIADRAPSSPGRAPPAGPLLLSSPSPDRPSSPAASPFRFRRPLRPRPARGGGGGEEEGRFHSVVEVSPGRQAGAGGAPAPLHAARHRRSVLPLFFLSFRLCVG